MNVQSCLFLTIIICAVFYPSWSKAQSLPVGTPVLEDAYRRAQLLGQVDSSISFTSRPIFPVESMKVGDAFDPLGSLGKERIMKPKGVFKTSEGIGMVKLLPFTIQQQFNTHHPYSLNDGPIIPGRGYQTLISGGFFAKFCLLSIQFRPEFVYAENRNYQGFYTQMSDARWYEYYQVQVFSDLPEKFGDKPYNKFLWGQSSIRLTLGSASIGLSNENLWWGPGMRNSLVMSNTADGFSHYTLNTVKPIRTPIGSFEGQIIAGRLENSGFDVPDVNRTFLGYSIYIPKKNDWRYINAMVLSYQPKWIPGLFIGMTRSFTKFHTEKVSSFRAMYPVFFPIAKKSFTSTEVGDQRVSAFVRWLCVAEHAEIYYEFMRESQPNSWRDFMLMPRYSSAYIFGLRKMIPLNRYEGQYIQVNFELTQLEQTNANPNDLYRYLYTSQMTHQGYTNNGQLLGAGIGPGSNLQSLSISWVNGLKIIGIQLERFVHNNDFHNIGIKDLRANWVDVSATGIVEWNWRNLLLSARFENVLSYNYEHFYRPQNPDSGLFFEPGINQFNFQAQVGVTYRF
ncbi:MAG: capsule assembly Wzi family protein [Mariniphaga sp.]